VLLYDLLLLLLLLQLLLLLCILIEIAGVISIVVIVLSCCSCNVPLGVINTIYVLHNNLISSKFLEEILIMWGLIQSCRYESSILQLCVD